MTLANFGSWIALFVLSVTSTLTAGGSLRTDQIHTDGQKSPWTKVDVVLSSIFEDNHFESRVQSLENSITLELDETSLDLELWSKNETFFFPLVLPSGDELLFQFESSSILHPNLQQNFPEIRSYVGRPVAKYRHKEMIAYVDYSPYKGFRAYIQSMQSSMYLDPFESNGQRLYRSYRQEDLTSKDAWGCNTQNHDILTKPGDFREMNKEERLPGTPTWEHHFTIALIANGEYSAFHGNTVPSVLSEMVTVMNRVNGIFKRELGVFFQLHENTTEMICLQPCDLPNSDAIMNKVDDFLAKRGVSHDTFDIGHSLTRSPGGVAYVASLCNSRLKTQATTGLSYPTADAFYVDYVAHELGHQLSGSHTFQDCYGRSTSNPDTAVEPGSGSTILGYAGICTKSYNLQKHSDPYFHSKSIEQMRSFLSGIAEEGSCGRHVRLPEKNFTSAVKLPEICRLPMGNFFGLEFLNAGMANGSYFTVELVTSRYEASLHDRSISKFRSWIPTQRPERQFPHMYHILHEDLTQVFDEVIPDGTRTEVLTFRGSVRTLFSKLRTSIDQSKVEGFGQVELSDSRITFDANLKPLKLKEASVYHNSSDNYIKVSWDVGGTAYLASEVEIFISNDEVASTEDEDAADWHSLGKFPNNGLANAIMSSKTVLNSSVEDIHLMVRSTESGCYFFDVLPSLQNTTAIQRPETTPSPTVSASSLGTDANNNHLVVNSSTIAIAEIPIQLVFILAIFLPLN